MAAATSALRRKRRRFFLSLRPSRLSFISLVFTALTFAAFIFLRPKVPLPLLSESSIETKELRNTKYSYEFLQQCVDRFTSDGDWDGSNWRVKDHPASCRFQQDWTDDELAATFGRVKVGFLGDSTTRSDLRAWEETYLCPRTNLDEAQIFQRKTKDGSYLCDAWEQSINLTKCGIPPIINVTACPGNVTFRYFYKIYPWTPLDQWYLSQKPSLFHDLDLLVISLGRWFVYYEPYDAFNITDHLDTFLVELKKVYSGTILYQSEYTEHLAKSAEVKFPVQCTPHATCIDCGEEQYECSQIDGTERPQSDVEMRSVFERHHILHLDRWNVSKSLPLDYFKPWYCHNETINQWDCSHHLGFVALQHMRLIANVIKNIFAVNSDRD